MIYRGSFQTQLESIEESSVEKEFQKKALEIRADRPILVERWNGGAVKIKLYNFPSTSEAFFTLCITEIKTQEEVNRKKPLMKFKQFRLKKMLCRPLST